jgi:large subunit ribosomal protein L3
MEGILGRKLGITQIFTADGATVPVTVVEAGPCVVVARRTGAKDGYDAVQIGLVEAKPPRRVTRPMQGHFKKADVTPTRRLAEFEVAADESLNPGDQIKVSIFQEQEYVDVVGTGKGKGFQGVIKRHGFGGGRATHGSMFHRAPGSIGGSSYPSRVYPGMRAAGRMGGRRVTVKNLLVVKVDPEKNLIYLRGAVPGAPNAYVAIQRAKRGRKAQSGTP